MSDLSEGATKCYRCSGTDCVVVEEVCRNQLSFCQVIILNKIIAVICISTIELQQYFSSTRCTYSSSVISSYSIVVQTNCHLKKAFTRFAIKKTKVINGSLTKNTGTMAGALF